MSYHSDHLAWQQRVAQEFKAQSAEQENSHMFEKNGQWYNYPDLVDYLRNQSFDPTNVKRTARPFGSNYGLQVPSSIPAMNYTEGTNHDNYMMTREGLIDQTRARTNSQQARIQGEISSQYGYAPKSKLIYQRGMDTRSQKSASSSVRRLQTKIGPHVDNGDTKSQLSKANMQRFNEEVPRKGTMNKTGSQVGSLRSVFSKQKSQVGSKVGSKAPSVFSQKTKQAAIAKAWGNQDTVDPEYEQNIDQANIDVAEDAQENYDQVQELPLDLDEAEEMLSSVSQLKPTASQLSKMSGKTYISQLQKQLNEEKYARENLEAELSNLKEISKEISSQLTELQNN